MKAVLGIGFVSLFIVAVFADFTLAQDGGMKVIKTALLDDYSASVIFIGKAIGKVKASETPIEFYIVLTNTRVEMGDIYKKLKGYNVYSKKLKMEMMIDEDFRDNVKFLVDKILDMYDMYDSAISNWMSGRSLTEEEKQEITLEIEHDKWFEKKDIAVGEK